MFSQTESEPYGLEVWTDSGQTMDRPTLSYAEI